ncbi:MAG TPA: tetratricopeptide repeat protein [Planctomycetota bacterium]|nr:tetratricopeptide repeat protein [Planctomycetota bacterium]
MTPDAGPAVSLARKTRETGIFAQLPDMGVLRVTGADAATFLHSQLTNEVEALKPGEGNLSARVTRTGALLRYFSLHRMPEPEEGFVLLLEKDGIAPLQSDLEKFAISDDVSFADLSAEYSVIALQGPQAAAFAEGICGKLGAEKNESWADLPENAIRFMGPDVLVVARSLTGDPGYLLLVETPPPTPSLKGRGEQQQGVLDTLMTKLASAAIEKNWVYLQGADLEPVLETLRIEAGIVKIGPDAQQGKLVLPETGMENVLVSYSKGCYLGQEVIARIRTYGSVPWVLRGLVFLTSAPAPVPQGERGEQIPPPHSDVILEDGKKAGTWASRAFSPVLNAPVALAYLDRTNRTPGTILKIRMSDGSIASARVQLLPFYKASDLKSRVAFLHDRAIRLFSDGKDDEAITMLEQALRLDPTFSDGYEALGVILGRSGRFNDAIEIFKRLEEVAPDEPMVHTNLSLYYMKIGDKEKAEEEKARATVKQFSRFGNLAKEQEREKQEREAKRGDALRKKAMFEEVLGIDPEDPIALFGLGNALSTLEQWSDAEAALAKACAVQKDNSAAYLAHGKALEMLNRNADALAVYKTGMAVASKKGDLMPLKEMERRSLLLERK